MFILVRASFFYSIRRISGNDTTKYLVLGLLFVWYSVYALCQMVYAQMLKIYAKELQVKEEESF